jgi:protein SCO1/2
MNRMRTIGWFAAMLLTAAAAPSLHAQAVPSDTGIPAASMPAPLRGVDFRPELDAQMPLDLPFRDETGRQVKLGDYFGQKPVVLAFVYFTCPMLCDQVQQGVVGTLRMLSFNPGRDYDVVFISFDARDTADKAAQKKAALMSHFRRPDTVSGWHFLTGSQESIDAATQAANFHFRYDAKNDYFAHASGILMLTPAGRISRYFYGIEYPGRDVRLGLVDASAGKIGSPIDHVLLFCYHYDPSTATYSASILKIMRFGAAVTVLVILAAIFIFRRRDHHASRANLEGAH